MLTILSPSKTQDYTDDVVDPTAIRHTEPALLAESQTLVELLRQQSPDELGQLMNVSDNLAALNHERYQHFSPPFTPNNARQALLAFRGDVYTDLAVEEYGPEDFAFAQDHLRILSGLYGLLRPLDLIQPYRLEMKTKLGNPRGSNLYEFWGNRLTEQLNAALTEQSHPTLINLASNEYFRAVNEKVLNAPVVTPVFKEDKNGQLKTVAIYAKRARGKMTNFIIRERIDDPQQLKTFSEDRYEYHEPLSSEQEWVFIR